MRNRSNYLSHFLSKEDRPFGRATGADNPTAARVGYKKVMTAFLTSHPRHSVLWDATLQTCAELVSVKE